MVNQCHIPLAYVNLNNERTMAFRIKSFKLKHYIPTKRPTQTNDSAYMFLEQKTVYTTSSSRHDTADMDPNKNIIIKIDKGVYDRQKVIRIWRPPSLSYKGYYTHMLIHGRAFGGSDPIRFVTDSLEFIRLFRPSHLRCGCVAHDDETKLMLTAWHTMADLERGKRAYYYTENEVGCLYIRSHEGRQTAVRMVEHIVSNFGDRDQWARWLDSITWNLVTDEHGILGSTLRQMVKRRTTIHARHPTYSWNADRIERLKRAEPQIRRFQIFRNAMLRKSEGRIQFGTAIKFAYTMLKFIIYHERRNSVRAHSALTQALREMIKIPQLADEMLQYHAEVDLKPMNLPLYNQWYVQRFPYKL